MKTATIVPGRYATILTVAAVCLALILTSHYSYLLFHSLAEVFSIIVACGIFMLAWNSRPFLDNNYLLFLGIAYLFIAFLDLIHTLAYKGMGVFPDYDANLPTQLWIATRYLESLSLLVSPLFLRRTLNPSRVWAFYAIVTGLVLAAIFGGVFPDCYIEGAGLTPFKIGSEYIISLILFGAIALLLRHREAFEKGVLWLLVGAIALTIGAELAFTFYVSVYGFSNLLGHLLKIASFYLVYRAIVETGLTRPYLLLFRNVKQAEERYRSLFEEAPLPLWEEDFSGVKAYLDGLRAAGVSDFRAYFAEHPDAIADCAGRVKIMSLNQAAIDHLKTRHQHEFHMDMTRVITERAHAILREEVIALAEGNTSFEGETCVHAVTGEEMHAVLRLRVVPGHEETWDRVFVSILDITGRRRAEEQRVELAVQRERVGILTDFIEGVSHEFNTPLSIIHSGLYLLERAADPAKRAAQLARLEEQASYLGELVEAMLTMSRLDSEAEMTFKPVNLNSLLRDVETRMRALADENQLALTVNLEGTLPTVQGDGAALHRALTNLVENAVQYTPPGGSITVEAGMQARDVVVTIRDTGIGISDEDLPRIFERFYRGDRARSSRGAGLGLPIVRKIVEMHGGCIEIESAPGEGSVFRVRLPLPE